MTSMQKTIAHSAIVIGLLAIFFAFGSSIYIAYHVLTSSGLTKIIFLYVNSKENKTLECQHCEPSTESLSTESNFEEGKWNLKKNLTILLVTTGLIKWKLENILVDQVKMFRGSVIVKFSCMQEKYEIKSN